MAFELIARIAGFAIAVGLSVVFFYIPQKRIPLSRENLRHLAYALGGFFAFFAFFTIAQDPRIMLFSPHVADMIILLGVTIFGLAISVAFINDRIVEYMVNKPLRIAKLKQELIRDLSRQLENHPDQPNNHPEGQA